jgi:addiction module RelE/StbE family toxin
MKNMKLYYSKEFVDDFLATVEYIKRENPQAARTFTKRINEKIKLLKKNPEMGKVLDEPELEGIRLLITGNYLVFYEMEPNENVIYLHGFCHGARDYPTIYKDLKN